MESNNKNQRSFSKILIYPQFQARLILANITLIVITIIAIGIQIHRSFLHLKEVGTSIGLPANHPYFEFIKYQNQIINSNLIYAFVFSAIVSTLLIFYYSHRVSGPIVRLLGFFKDMNKGMELKPLTFRKGDYFTELTIEINSVIESMRKDKKIE